MVQSRPINPARHSRRRYCPQATLAALCSMPEASATTLWWASPPGAKPSARPPASHGAPMGRLQRLAGCPEGSRWLREAQQVLPLAVQAAASVLRVLPTGRCMRAVCARSACPVQPRAVYVFTPPTHPSPGCLAGIQACTLMWRSCGGGSTLTCRCEGASHGAVHMRTCLTAEYKLQASALCSSPRFAGMCTRHATVHPFLS